MVYFSRKYDKKHGFSSITNIMTITIGEIECPVPVHEKIYQTIMIGSMPIQVEVTRALREVQGSSVD
jgi:hypothetical protein